MKSEFAEWFNAQHGQRESGLFARHSDQMLRDDIQRGKMAAAALEARTLWDEKQQSAMYAWQARSKTPNAELTGQGGCSA